ncbi:hypothetical protein LO772_33550 [Yinghuangia sp. ASG 101]|uniref:FAD-dependent oxidoreductase n=1 Tax=Yinghuangia sp. ASG 101 TaxID=2896848 RepID=UPI001E51C24C|nr:FAD-dependent oxidoreductase [Yinghuangia sp. ASG 101]UGQ11645.1 hypothetical protein LO772_33550 [Yinghuangia sp. ASG 101]
MRTAVVLGAGIAGLLAARVLAEHADQVVVVERDDVGTGGEFGDGGVARKGVPQGTQMHVLLEAGRRTIDRWLPGFSDELAAAGAATGSTGGDVHCYLDGRHKVAAGDLVLISATRPFLEAHLRRRVLGHANIRLVVGAVRGLVFAGDRVVGVLLSDGTAPVGAAEDAASPRGGDHTLTADFVVDATGRGTRIGAWLTEADWPQPPMRRISVDLGYATAVLRAPADAADGATIAQSLDRRPDGRVRLATLGRVEGDRWVALVAGYGEDRPARTAEDFLARCRNDPAAAFGKLAANASLVGEPAVYRHPDNRRRDFTEVARFPGGLVCVGDAVASFNPVYGQGMSSAAIHAARLAAYLESGASPHRPARPFFDAIRPVVDEAWQTSVLNDLRLPHVDAPKPFGFRVATALGDMVLRASVTDPTVGLRFFEVMHMLAPPTTLMRPTTLLRSARAARRRPTT